MPKVAQNWCREPELRTDRWWSVVQLLLEQHRHSIQGGKGGHRAPGLLLPPFQGVSPPSGLLRCRQPFTVRSSVYLFSLRLLQPSLVLIVGWNLSLAPPAKTDNTLIDSWNGPESISIHTFPVSLLNIFLLSRWLMLELFPLHKSFSFARSITRASLGTRGLRAGSEAKWFRDPHFTETLPGPGWGPCGITCDAPDTTHQASFARNHKQDAKLQHNDCSWW